MRIDNPSVSGSITFIGGNNTISADAVSLTGSLSGSFAGEFTGEAQTAISGAASIDTSSLATTGSNTFIGNQTHSGSILPAVNDVYDLGSTNYQWRDLFLSSGSLYINGTQVISSDANTLTFTTDAGQSIKILETGGDDITFQTDTGNIEMKGTIEVQSGKKIIDSAGTVIQFGDTLGVTGSIEVSGTVDGIDLQEMSSSLSASIAGVSGSSTSLSSSLASELLKNTSDTLTGDLTVTGTLTAQEFHTEFVSASILFDSGSTKFGDTQDDVHTFTGSLNVTGSSTFADTLQTTQITATNGLNYLKRNTDASLQLRSENTRSGLFITKPATDTVMGSALVLADESYRLGTANYYHMYMLQNGNTYFNQNVGIGIAPSKKLTIFGTGAGNATVQIEGEGGADPYINFLANNTQHWSLGIDDSDSDKFKLSEHSALGTNDYFVVDTSGNVTLNSATALDFQVADFAQIKFRESGAITIDSDNDQSSRNFAIKDGSGSNLLTVLDTGRIGIGTASPGYLFNVVNDDTATWTARFTNNTNNVYLSVNDANNYGIYVSGESKNYFSNKIGIGTTSPEAMLDFSNSIVTKKIQLYGSNNNYRFYGFGIEASTLVYSVFDTGDDHVFFAGTSDTARNELMRIEGTGNVGIGTPSPTTKLSVSDGASMYANSNYLVQIKRNSTNGNDDTSKASILLANNSNAMQIAYGGTTDRLRIIDGGATERFTMLNGGNVGIGTTSPQGLTHFYGNGNSTYIVNQKNSTKWSEWHVGGSNHAFIWDSTADMRFMTTTSLNGGGASEKMRIASNGAIGIGGANYGSSGQVLTSNGNAAPSWQAAGGSAWPQEKFAEYTIDSTTSNILVATLNSTTWHGNYLAGCLKFTFNTSDFIQITYLTVSTFLSAGNKLFFKGNNVLTTHNSGTNPAQITITFAGNNGSYGSTCTVKLNRNQSNTTYPKVNVLIQAISSPNMFILN